MRSQEYPVKGTPGSSVGNWESFENIFKIMRQCETVEIYSLESDRPEFECHSYEPEKII